MKASIRDLEGQWVLFIYEWHYYYYYYIPISERVFFTDLVPMISPFCLGFKREWESFGIREKDYKHTTHHFVVDDNNDGGEEKCEPFDQRKKETSDKE